MNFAIGNKPAAATPKKFRHVALIIETSNEYARGILRGVQSYLKEHRPWSIDLREQSRDHLDWSWLAHWKGDGIIARVQNEEMEKFLIERALPTVNVSSSRIVPGFPCVETDDTSIALQAAKHLLDRDFKHVAFCGNSNYAWSNYRCQAFRDFFIHQGRECPYLDTAHADSDTNHFRRMLMDWVGSLPSPIGIMTSYDTLGQQLLEACRHAGLSVPDQVGVIGVDNDELLCELSTPSLTSIIPDTVKTGYLAAQLLEQMMNGHSVDDIVHKIKPLGLATRLSTDRIIIDDPIVSAAIRFIRNHAYDRINVEEIVKALNTSRRILENRFKKALGKTPHEEIMDVKINLLKQMLDDTRLSLYEIALRSGFENPEYMNVLFKRKVGVSPGKYRERNRRRGTGK